MRSVLNSDNLSKLIREQRLQQEAAREKERELDIYRSGSAPPTVEGSLRGLFGTNGLHSDKGEFFTEEEIRSDPAYVEYYYSSANLNPRMPTPLLSKEDWKTAHRGHGAFGVNSSVIGDRRMGLSRDDGDEEGNRSLFDVQRGFDVVSEESENVNGAVDWGRDGLIGLPNIGGLHSRRKSIAEIFQDDIDQANPASRHPSRPASQNAFDDDLKATEDQFAQAHPFVGASAAQTYASALSGSLSRINSTHGPQFEARVSGPRVPPIGGGRGNPIVKRDLSGSNSFNGVSSSLGESAELVAALSGLNLSTNCQGRGDPPYQTIGNDNNSPFANYGLNGYQSSSPPMLGSQLGGGNLPPLFENAAAQSVMGRTGLDSRSLSALGPNSMETLYGQYMRSNEYAAMQLAALNNPSMVREYLGNSYTDLVQKACLNSILSQKSPYGALKNHNYHPNPAFGFGMSYSGSPVRHSERAMRFSSGMRNLDETFASSLLDEFKSNKTKCFELSDISGHVVEFSSDQYGSRFIQQKLETASTEEKDMVFNEIMPHALSLMTDVFGNYVVQKFFEHGSSYQIRELANQLIGHVLALSLQMYGCRVIQKAIEVVELDQQKSMVKELDGHIMRCVRDQNGNHVIQKCIECVPEDAIQFIVSTFYDQVVTLSTHPYGCRVIQRVLEHCHNARTQQIMMDEILQHICMLAQDQYGNYVVQHVLEHGKPHERTEIINKLRGLIVQMSQQKYASNVIEKCLTFGTAKERQDLVNEMLGTIDENEPLQVMMKDQFANYVVQKVLETCDDQQLELILNRIKTHLTALKKYTYGKHIVARVEKLVAAGERRISILTQMA